MKTKGERAIILNCCFSTLSARKKVGIMCRIYVPNLCVVHNESGEENVFSGPNTRDNFCEWLFQEQNSSSIVMAHNFQGYDGYFILQYLHKNGLVPEVIMRGAKILTLNVPMLDIKFVDSLCFIPMRLANFPKTFGLNELAKGYFPHYFNIEANQNYEGPLRLRYLFPRCNR